MKMKQFLNASWTVPMFTMGVLGSLMQPSKATTTNINITCQTNGIVPTVIATATEGKSVKNITILSFPSQYFSPQDAVQNCQNTAKSLQSLYDTDSANYLTSAKLDAKVAVCAVERRGIGCDHNNAQILFTLDSTTNPSQALYEMLGSDFKQAQPPNSRTVSRIYSDIKPRGPRWWPF